VASCALIKAVSMSVVCRRDVFGDRLAIQHRARWRPLNLADLVIENTDFRSPRVLKHRF